MLRLATDDLTANVIDSNLPPAVICGMLRPTGVQSAESLAPGMSGACVYRCHLASGQQLALKRWPDGTPRSRVQEVHQIIGTARDSGDRLVPEVFRFVSLRSGKPTSIFTEQGSHWELAQWMDGLPAPRDASLTQIQSGAAAVAQFHASVRPLGTRVERPPAILARISRLAQLAPLLPQAMDRNPPASTLDPQCPELADTLRRACGLIRWRWESMRRRITDELNRYAHHQVQTQYVLRDIHRGHVLFRGVRPTGLIDFDAIRVDAPETDLARWVGSFLGGKHHAEDVWEAAVAGFRQENPLISGATVELDPKIAKVICAASIWISLANWLVWILIDGRVFPSGPHAVAQRIGELADAACEEG